VSESRISSAVFVQMSGRGWVFQSAIQARMSFSRARTLLCAPRRIFCWVRKPNQRGRSSSINPSSPAAMN
jgi:hypothetical protein